MTDIRADAPGEVPFLFQQSQKRVGGSMGVSLAVHAAVIALIIFFANRQAIQTAATALFPETLPKDIVWLDMNGPGGGGGGGGNRSVEPPRKAELEGKDKLTVPAVKPPSMEMKKEEPPPPVQELNIPAQTLASANLALPGVLEGAPPNPSLGSGSGGGGGTGTGTGIGSGTGSGLGAGFGGGTGGGVFRPGNGVETPRLLNEVKPQYTAQAMRAKIQGTVLLECVVQPDGTVGNIRVVRSLDSAFGLDQEAIKALRGWKFAPGTRMGTPVAVLVTVEIAFTLR
ncbi:MAG TPA: energy transducer TonB [Vicinamibacterales bacterium]|nr:energy transducer TonB [Vicinamibacterales bacterium]